MTAKPDPRFFTRRSVIQALMSVPALVLFHEALSASTMMTPPAPGRDGVVEINGWILKRSEVA